MTLSEQQLWILVPCLIGAVVLWFAPAPSAIIATLRGAAKADAPKQPDAISPLLAAIYGIDVAIEQLQTIGALDESNANSLTLCDAHAALRAKYLPYMTDRTPKAKTDERTKPKA